MKMFGYSLGIYCMIEKINEPISVALLYNGEKRQTRIWVLEWRKKRYLVSRLGFQHVKKMGNRLYQVFEVLTTDGLQMCLLLDTQSLNWTLEEVSDGQAE